MIKPNAVVRIPTTLDNFFKQWLIFLKPFHGLTDRQIDIAAVFLKQRYELSKVISDEKLLDENVMSESTKKQVREECNITLPHFQVIMGDLKRHKFLINGIINELLGKRTIGGKNLLSQTAFSHTYYTDQIVSYTKILSLDAGKTYVASYGKFEDNAYVGDEEWAKGVCLVVVPVGNVVNATNIESVHKFGEPIEVNYNGRDLYIAWGVYDYIKDIIGTDPQDRAQHEFTQYLDEVMVQEGTTPTAFQPSIDEELSPINESVNSLKYLKTALENETTVAGGLLATSVILLRNGNEVTAGISGVKDDNILAFGGGSYEEAVNAASPGNDFHVGENKTGRQITTLIKKDGQSRNMLI